VAALLAAHAAACAFSVAAERSRLCACFRALCLLSPPGPGVSALASCLCAARLLQEVDLAGCAAGDAGAGALAAVLPGANVTRLTLARCAIGAVGAGALADALRAGAPLTHLTLTGNEAIGDAGAESLAAALFLASHPMIADADANGNGVDAAAPRLARLDLGACGIGAAGAVALLRAGGVAALSLFGNDTLGDDGAAAIADALSAASPAGLTCLDLSGTGIGRDGGAALAAALAAGAAPGLLTLELGANPVRLSVEHRS
jgi:hypothetical protein